MFYLSRSEQVAVVVLLALLVAGAGVFAYARGQRSARAAPGPLFVEAPTRDDQSRALVVHVSGAVRLPGIYQLPVDSRVADALGRAGGTTPDANVDTLDLAAQLDDGARLHVPTRGETAGPEGVQEKAHPTVRDRAGVISLNTATKEQLESLPGIGPVYAEGILTYREQLRREEGRGFRSVDELLNVPGIGPRRLAGLRDHVVP